MQPQTPPNPPSPASPTPAVAPSDAAIAARLASLAREVESLQGHLEHAQRLASLGTIASIIAHEFNNILTPVMSYAQMALANPHDQQLLVKSAQRAYDGADKASQIAAAILGFARDEFASLDGGLGGPASGGSQLIGVGSKDCPGVGEGGGQGLAVAAAPRTERVDILAAVQGALACLAREPSKDGIKLELDIPERTFAAMRPVALQQVLLNLILNARRSMAGSRTGGTLRIAAVVSGGVGGAGQSATAPLVPSDATASCSTWNEQAGAKRADGWVTMTVTDTGHGMTPEQLNRMFCAFVTGHGADRQTHRGTGLGLTVCQRLIEQAGGTLWCKSQVSVGTEFTIAVPACF